MSVRAWDILLLSQGAMLTASSSSSEAIAQVFSGSLDDFKKLDKDNQERCRILAIEYVSKDCTKKGKIGVVAGHYMFWEDDTKATGHIVWTQGDLEMYSHILYLKVPAEVIAIRRKDDKYRPRPALSAEHLQKWQGEEDKHLRRLCRDNGILYLPVTPPSAPSARVAMLLRFLDHNEEYNLTCAKGRLDEVLTATTAQPKTMLVIDADKTLAAQDAGALFSKKAFTSTGLSEQSCPLKALFSSPLGYTYTAFRQATLLFEEAANDEEFENLCSEVAEEVTMHPEFVSLLQLVAQNDDVGAIVVSCGLRRVWEKVLERERLSKTVQVIAGGRIADNIVVTAAVKSALVTHLKDIHDKKVIAFGDSPLDLDMLREADDAIVVVGDELTRSQSMDKALTNAINNHGLQARQALLPSDVTPRLNAAKLSIVNLTGHNFIDEIFGKPFRQTILQASLATEKGAGKLLATPTRDSAIAGPALKDAHRQVGKYLAIEYLTEVIGLEKRPIRHVQNQTVSGYRLWHEKQTTIVALMRGGEPMASGVNDAFPLAMFVHANKPEDIKDYHLEGQITVLLVDSVINKGNTMVEFINHVRKLHATIRIVLVGGVVQAEVVRGTDQAGSGPRSILVNSASHHKDLELVALRTSGTSFVGSGSTDTGNRLFNTTHLEK